MRALVFLWMSLACASAWCAEPAIPACRLDSRDATLVKETLERSAAVYKAIGKPLPFDTVAVNPTHASNQLGTLTVYILRDAAAAAAKSNVCARAIPDKEDVLDDLSVTGGCETQLVGAPELRCSSRAVRLFGDRGNKIGRQNPALLYVLSHELGHVYQGARGDYSERVAAFKKAQMESDRLSQLREYCKLDSFQVEKEADEFALDVLTRLLPDAPYREPLFSPQGSMYWNIDQLALASDAWRRDNLEREIVNMPKVHPSFTPTEFPTPPQTVEVNAQRFVCDALGKSGASVRYPGRQVSHPSPEERLQRAAEALRSVAQRLPASGGQTPFAPVARLQQDISPILTEIYRETGAYANTLRKDICTIVNSDAPKAGCR
jgi:hypothetical protein